MSFSFLLMISRRPRNSRSFENVADCVKRSRASSISLRSVWRSFSSEWMRASSSELRASASFTRRSSRPKPSASTATPDASVASVAELDLVGRGRNLLAQHRAPAPAPQTRRLDDLGTQRLAGAVLSGSSSAGILSSPPCPALPPSRGSAADRRPTTGCADRPCRWSATTARRDSGLQRRERRLRLGIELLALERRRRRGSGQLLLGRVAGRSPSPPISAALLVVVALLTMTSSSSSASTMSESASSS